MTLTSIIAGIGWDPEIRGILAFLLGVTVLCGSVYLLLATNLATRLGFLVALTGLMGWIIVLGAIWWMYGIGLQGDTPEWQVREVNFGDLEAAATNRVSDIDITVLPPFEQLNELEPAEYDEARDRYEPELAGWRLLPETDPSFGEAMATVDEYLATGAASAIGVEGTGDYVPTYAFERGGKAELPRDPSRFDRVANWFHTTFVQVRHPTRYAVIQVAPTLPETRPEAAQPGEAPPTLEADPSMPMISVVLQRDLGQERVPAALITLGSLAIFGVLCFMLHRRDQLVARHRALVPATAG
jgi:hypothetical protein